MTHSWWRIQKKTHSVKCLWICHVICHVTSNQWGYMFVMSPQISEVTCVWIRHYKKANHVVSECYVVSQPYVSPLFNDMSWVSHMLFVGHIINESHDTWHDLLMRSVESSEVRESCHVSGIMHQWVMSRFISHLVSESCHVSCGVLSKVRPTYMCVYIYIYTHSKVRPTYICTRGVLSKVRPTYICIRGVLSKVRPMYIYVWRILDKVRPTNNICETHKTTYERRSLKSGLRI